MHTADRHHATLPTTTFEAQAAYLVERLPAVMLRITALPRRAVLARALPPAAPRPIAVHEVEVCDLPVDPIARGRVITARLKAGEMSIGEALQAFNAAGPFPRRVVEIDAVEVR